MSVKELHLIEYKASKGGNPVQKHCRHQKGITRETVKKRAACTRITLIISNDNYRIFRNDVKLRIKPRTKNSVEIRNVFCLFDNKSN